MVLTRRKELRKYNGSESKSKLEGQCPGLSGPRARTFIANFFL